MSIMNTREKLETQIHNCKSYYRTGLALVLLLVHPKTPDMLREKGTLVRVGDHEEKFDKLADYLEDPDMKKMIGNDIHNIFLRFIFREPYELIFNYCKNSNQLDKLRSKDWFHFARLCRNAMAHNLAWKFTNDDRRILPVTYWGQTISEDMEGITVTREVLTFQITWNLNSDFLRFVRDDLEDSS